MHAVGVQTQFPTCARVAFETCGRATKLDAILDYGAHCVVLFTFRAFRRSPPMRRISAVLLAILLSSAAHAAEYMEKTPFQLSRAFSPGVITSGGTIVWVAGQTATQDSQGNNIANNFEAQVKQVFAQIDGIMKRAGGSLDNVVTMTVFIKESRYGDRFVEMRTEVFKNGNYPG